MENVIDVVVADESHEKYIDTILQTISDAAKVRGTGIAKRTHEYVLNKMREARLSSRLMVTNLPVSAILRPGRTRST